MKVTVDSMVFKLSGRGPVVSGNGVHEDFAFNFAWWAPSSIIFQIRIFVWCNFIFLSSSSVKSCVLVLARSSIWEPEWNGTSSEAEKSALKNLRIFGNQNSSSNNINKSIDVDEKGTSTSSDNSHNSSANKENLNVFICLDWSVSIELPENCTTPSGVKRNLSSPTFEKESLQECGNWCSHKNFPSQKMLSEETIWPAHFIDEKWSTNWCSESNSYTSSTSSCQEFSSSGIVL